MRRRSADREPTEARANTERAGADTDSPDAALATLRRRYARGDLTDDQFERRVERLLETEETADTVVSIRED
ncbi:SHOCT domain-containing protein [Halobaculum litoreum]|uniref:SHOCT domain-containing protein n=1 Tax=Halobaculum litoreum TaxID=3031998 RepID=A0ABD5XSL1_9EURY